MTSDGLNGPFWDEMRDRALKQLKDDEEGFDAEMLSLMQGSAAAKEFYGAKLAARRAALLEEIMPTLHSDFSLTSTARQGIKAACLAREDGAAVLQIQMDILNRLDRIRAVEAEFDQALTMVLADVRWLKRIACAILVVLFAIAVRLA